MKIEFQNWHDFTAYIISSFGGWALVVAALTAFLANIYTSRILHRETAKFSEKLTDIQHELRLRESSYSKHLDLLLDYYSVFYRHYRLCQNAVNQDAFRLDDNLIINTRDVFWQQLDIYLSEFKAQEGKTRLVLPAELLKLHEDSIKAFNQFKNVMKQTKYDEKFNKEKREAFANVDRIKNQLEKGLREFLRTERMIVK